MGPIMVQRGSDPQAMLCLRGEAAPESAGGISHASRGKDREHDSWQNAQACLKDLQGLCHRRL